MRALTLLCNHQTTEGFTLPKGLLKETKFALVGVIFDSYDGLDISIV